MRCAACGSEGVALDPEEGELVCTRCGAVQEGARLDPGPEWRTFEGEECEQRRAGPRPSMLIPKKGLPTSIGIGPGCEPEVRARYGRLSAWQRRLSRDVEGLNEVALVAERLNLPEGVAEEAARLLRGARRGALARRENLASAAACVLYAARLRGCPLTLSEVARASNRGKKEVGALFRKLIKEFGQPRRVEPEALLAKLASKANLPQRVLATAAKILRLARARGVGLGMHSSTLAAGALYYAARLEGTGVSQRRLALSGAVTEVSVRNGYYALLKGLGAVTKEGLERELRSL